MWEYYIGGYQVIKKWLSYREDEILGRALKPEEAREVMNMARRIAAIILLQPKLDENYRNVAAAAAVWSSARSRAAKRAEVSLAPSSLTDTSSPRGRSARARCSRWGCGWCCRG